MSIVADRVRESTSTTGTGTLTLDGATTGFRTFTSAFGNGVSVYYAIVGGAEWEIGVGTTGAGTLTRNTVLASSAGGTTPVTFSAGVKDVFNTAPAAGLVLVGQTLASLTVSGTATAGKFAPTANTVAGNGMYLPAADTVAFSTDGTERWRITSAGNLITGTDNVVDIGASGATRPRDVFIARRANIDGITVGRGGQTTVSSNTAVGSSALNSASLTGTNNTAVGVSALQNTTTGGSNSAMGVAALRDNTTGGANSAVGASALQNNTTGGFNSAVGTFALQLNTTGGNNSAVGTFALQNNTTGGSNSAVGVSALLSNITGSFNSAVGLSALRNNTTGGFNSAVGVNALRRIAGSNNVAVGFESGIAISRGVATLGTIVGGSLYTDGTYNNVNLTRASGSTFDVFPTANITVSGGAVTAVTLVTGGSGFQATNTVLTATAASIGGTGSGFTVAVATLTGAVSSDNTLLGYQAANTQTEGSGNIAIGSGVQLDSLTGSDQINVGTRYFHDRIRLLERSSDPAKPAEGNVVLWMSDGTGLGDDGDVLIGSTAGGVTNYAILFDHSGGTLWP